MCTGGHVQGQEEREEDSQGNKETHQEPRKEECKEDRQCRQESCQAAWAEPQEGTRHRKEDQAPREEVHKEGLGQSAQGKENVRRSAQGPKEGGQEEVQEGHEEAW